jgi:hypothetical protein
VLSRISEAGHTVVFVLPITHSAPQDKEDGVEIPAATKRRLGLDSERSWIITTELNQFTWPGPDIRPTATGEFLYGMLPESLMRAVLAQVRVRARDKRLQNVSRTE